MDIQEGVDAKAAHVDATSRRVHGLRFPLRSSSGSANICITYIEINHNYLIDYTTAFEIKVGDWRMYHSGDCSNVGKLNPIWGSPDLWVVFPGCGIDIGAGARKLKPRQMAFGHLWELAHDAGRLTTPMVRQALARVEKENVQASVPMWGERIV